MSPQEVQFMADLRRLLKRYEAKLRDLGDENDHADYCVVGDEILLPIATICDEL